MYAVPQPCRTGCSYWRSYWRRADRSGPRMPESDVPCVPRTLTPQVRSFQWKSGQLSHPDPPKGPDGTRPWVVAAVGVALVATAAVVVLAWRRR